MSKYVGFKLGKVHESHVISEYYCGRCGYPVTDHDSFCPECGGSFRECDASDLEDENARLRELLKDTLPFVKYSCGDWCRWHDECDIATCYAYDDARERAGKMGIEMGA